MKEVAPLNILIAFEAGHMGRIRSLQIKGPVPQIDVYQIMMIAYSEKVDNGLTLLRSIDKVLVLLPTVP